MRHVRPAVRPTFCLFPVSDFQLTDVANISRVRSRIKLCDAVPLCRSIFNPKTSTFNAGVIAFDKTFLSTNIALLDVLQILTSIAASFLSASMLKI